MNNDKVISTLNDLIEACRDGQAGFKEAAEYAESPELKTFFRQESLERAQFVGDLQQQVQSLGGNPDNSGSTAGAVHRAWMTIKGTLTGKDDKSILNEVERGEDSAVEAFEDALRLGLPTNLSYYPSYRSVFIVGLRSRKDGPDKRRRVNHDILKNNLR
jgi:uncharacterized protein (TIGR02284 family)